MQYASKLALFYISYNGESADWCTFADWYVGAYGLLSSAKIYPTAATTKCNKNYTYRQTDRQQVICCEAIVS